MTNGSLCQMGRFSTFFSFYCVVYSAIPLKARQILEIVRIKHIHKTQVTNAIVTQLRLSQFIHFDKHLLIQSTKPFQWFFQIAIAICDVWMSAIQYVCTDERTQVNKSVFSARFQAEMLLNWNNFTTGRERERNEEARKRDRKRRLSRSLNNKVAIFAYPTFASAHFVSVVRAESSPSLHHHLLNILLLFLCAVLCVCSFYDFFISLAVFCSSSIFFLFFFLSLNETHSIKANHACSDTNWTKRNRQTENKQQSIHRKPPLLINFLRNKVSKTCIDVCRDDQIPIVASAVCAGGAYSSSGCRDLK